MGDIFTKLGVKFFNKGLVIWFEIILKHDENGLDYVWKCEPTSLNKSSGNNWVVLKRTDRCQLLLNPEYLVDTSQILPYLANVPR